MLAKVTVCISTIMRVTYCLDYAMKNALAAVILNKQNVNR